MLAQIGAASAHPGGPSITRFWCGQVYFRGVHDVLEVGCGTGRSLVEVCQTYGCSGTGVDIRPVMVRKAKQRAKHLNVSDVRFQTSPAEKLPFPDASFDLVYTESVNVFLTEPQEALREYLRVLRPGGVYVDVEMLVLQPVDEGWRHGVQKVYGARFVPDQTGWRKMYRQAGFADVTVLTTRSVDPFSVAAAPDRMGHDADLTTPGAYERPDVQAALRANAAWMETNYRPLGYGAFLCKKDAPTA
jgi:SAM-dependent methyltransferase